MIIIMFKNHWTSTLKLRMFRLHESRIWLQHNTSRRRQKKRSIFHFLLRPIYFSARFIVSLSFIFPVFLSVFIYFLVCFLACWGYFPFSTSSDATRLPADSHSVTWESRGIHNVCRFTDVVMNSHFLTILLPLRYLIYILHEVLWTVNLILIRNWRTNLNSYLLYDV